MNHQPRYDILDQLISLKDNYDALDADTRAMLKARVILNSADPRAAVLAADISGDDWANIYPPTRQPRVSTTSAIDTFLETYGHASPEEDALLERLIFNPTPDYSAVLEARDPQEDPSATPDLTSSRIDSFMAAHQTTPMTTPEPTAPIETPATNIPQDSTHLSPTTPSKTPHTSDPTPSSLNESLAKIYIKQGRYRRAYEIISDLNLKYPEKSVYFADQLRFLNKLIALSERTGK
ncbi:MAG: hypothetical protein J6C44_06115 [Muribaculaceae bacterium]|nr:hypothetical protein [Muribaculaceae bacterium]MBO5187525.1 hypothetical protein [Prevotella sp.]